MSHAGVSALRAARDAGVEARCALFEQLVSPQFTHIYRLAYRLTRSTPEAEDLMQDVLVLLYQRCDELAGVKDLRSWLGRVVYNRFVDQYRARLRRRVAEPADLSASEGNESLLNSIPSEAPGPEETAVLAAQLSQLDVALDRLNDDQRIAVLLHDAEGYTLEEIEKVTGTPVATIKTRLHRGRAKMRTLLGQGTFFA